MKRKLLLTLAVLLVIGTAKAQTDRWIFPLVFTDATNNPDTVWFIQYNNEITTLETILQEEGINPDVDTTRFHVYFTDSNGIKTRIATRQFSGNFNDVTLEAGLCEFPIQASWDKNLLSLSSELFGPITYSTIKSLYTEICSVDGGAPTDDDDLWANIFSMMDSTGQQPAAYYSENGAFYGDDGMLSWFLDSFFPMYVTLTREHFHSGNIHGLTASTNGHNVILNWNYGGCEHIDHFEVYRGTLGGTLLSHHTTTETHFEEENVPAGQYEYMIDGYFTDGSHIYDPILYNPYPSVTVEVQDDTVSNTFAPATAEWYFGLSSFMGGPMSYYKMEVLGDTVVQGHNCSIITAPYIGGNGGNQYVYEENNVVYWYNVTTDAFTILYNFNANAGDSWTCDIDTCSYQVTVTSIDSVTWGGHTYRVQNVTSDWNIMEGKIIDGIGYEGGLFPFMWACSYEVYDGTYPYYLRCYLEDGEKLYHEGDYDCDETQKTDRWIFPLVFTDATNNPDTVWFVQHDYVTTLEDILNEEGINPNVRDENEFRVYFMQDGEKTRVVSSHFDEAFIKEQIYADNYVFPIAMNWRKILLEQYFEFFGPMAHTSLESAYTQSGFTIEGVEVIDGETEWYGVFNTYGTTGLQPAAYYSEEGTYFNDDEMLQSFYTHPAFFPMEVSMSRSCLYHAGSLSGVSTIVDGHDVTISWNYYGCDNPEYFIITRITSDESDYEVFTTTETTFTDHNVPVGSYTYKLDGYYSDGEHITDNPPYYYGVDVTIEPDFASQGFEWYYELQNPDGSITYQHLYYLADTTIREKDIDIIVRTNTLYDKGTNTTHEYIYEEEGKVFWWNATIDDFTMLYDFTAMPSDEWEIKVGTESITMHVDAVGETEYNGKTFKTLQVSDAGNVFSGTIVAKVGHLTSFFPEKLMRKSGESTVEGLRCLWNGTELVFKYGDKDCDEIYEQLHYGLKDVETEAFSLYPNPTEGVLTVETQNLASPQKQTSYRILNLMGQTLLEGLTEGGSTRIDVSSLSNGMYFINIEGATQKFVIKK